jgi:hypothetical protein
MAYDIKAKFIENSPLPCWKGYERVPGTKQLFHYKKEVALKKFVYQHQK